jgi:predicted CXXCH cytochrome family protein
MGCISCHDPHSTPAPENRVQFYRDQCLSCHSKPQSECVVDVAKRVQISPEDSCIQCHMPALPAADVQHTSQTDHRILRNPEAAPVSDSSETLQLAANMDTIPEWEIRRAKGLLMAQYSVDQNDGALATLATSHLEELQRQGLNDTLVENALGNVYLLLNRLEVAEKHWKRALELDPNNEAALRSLAIAMHDAGRDEEADLYMRKYKKGNQWDRVIIGRHIHLLGRLGRQSEAFAEGETALEKYPFDRLLREWMANACLANQRKTEAQTHKAIAERLTPGN